MRNPSLRLNLKSLLNKKVMIKIRIYNTFLQGRLISFDQYSNLLLDEAIELQKNEEEPGKLIEIEKYSNTILLRGDSIISITTKN